MGAMAGGARRRLPDSSFITAAGPSRGGKARLDFKLENKPGALRAQPLPSPCTGQETGDSAAPTPCLPPFTDGETEALSTIPPWRCDTPGAAEGHALSPPWGQALCFCFLVGQHRSVFPGRPRVALFIYL